MIAPEKSIAAVTNVCCDPARTAGTKSDRHTTISMPAASAAAASAGVDAVTWASRLPVALRATMPATVTVRTASRPL